MSYIEILRTKLKESEEKISKIKVYVEDIEEKTSKLKLNFEEVSELSYVNHIAACIERVLNKEKLEFVSEDMIESLKEELSENAIKISIDLLNKVYTDSKNSVDEGEVCLLATHIQMALSKEVNS